LKAVKPDQILNAVNTSREALLAEKEAILSMLGISSRPLALNYI
jgi:hypothetical protein